MIAVTGSAQIPEKLRAAALGVTGAPRASGLGKTAAELCATTLIISKLREIGFVWLFFRLVFPFPRWSSSPCRCSSGSHLVERGSQPGGAIRQVLPSRAFRSTETSCNPLIPHELL